MRKSHGSGGSNLDQQLQEPLPGENPEAKGYRGVGEPASRGGLRLRGRVTRRSKRALKEDLELATYSVSSETGSHFVEDFAPPGGPYLSLGQGGRSGSCRSHVRRQESTGVFTTANRSNGRRVLNPTSACLTATPPKR